MQTDKANSFIEPPFEAYSGQDPYLFISYSHKDSALIYPEIERLHKLGFRIWYDEGIDPGNEWPDEVAKALDRCSFFIVFISPRSVESKNVRNEINFALSKHKQFLAVHVEETSMPLGLELQIGGIQAVLKYRMPEESYQRKMQKVFPLSLKEIDSVSSISKVTELRDFIQTIVSEESPDGSKLKFLEGFWDSSPLQSNHCIRLINGVLYVAYCYNIAESLTGVYYNFKYIDDRLFAQWKWLDNSLSGYATLKIMDNDTLVEDWWYSHDVPIQLRRDYTKLNQDLELMNETTWKRIKGMKKSPIWADSFFMQLEDRVLLQKQGK